MGQAYRFSGRRLGLAIAMLAMVAWLLPATAAQAAGSPPAGDDELFVVAVNAKQRDLDSARMDGLVDRLVNHTSHAPDVIFVSEITKTNLLALRDRLNLATDDSLALYWTAGITTNSELSGPFDGSNIKVKILINSKTLDPDANVAWLDACTNTRTYQLITAQKHLAGGGLGRPVALAGVHFAPSFNEGGSVECKERNAEEARRQMAAHADSGIMGDFNRRATTDYYECDPVAPGSESGALEPWYETMTAPSIVDGRSYRDTVRAAHLGTTSMPAQWSFEKETTEALCDGSNGYKRSRLDYIFVSDEMTPKSAGTDQGWGTGAPGDPACSTPGCKYSDHRFVWAHVDISTHSTTPTRPTNLAVTPPTEEGRLDLTWTASDGATAYDVYRYDADLALRTWRSIATVMTNSYSDQDPTLVDGTTYHYRVVAKDAAGHSRPSELASATTLAPTPNQAPVVTITSPLDTTIEPEPGTQSATFTLAATATDDSGDPAWTWSDGSGLIAESAATTVTRPVGTHTFVVTATDTEGAFDTESVEITIAENTAPQVTITDPEPTAPDGTVTATADSTGFAQVPAAATADDEDPGALTWAWTGTSDGGTTFTGEFTPAASATTASTTAKLPVGTHVLAATASDGRLSGSDDVTVIVEAAPPAPTYVDDVAVSETAVKGTVTNTFAATHTAGGTAQTITEVSSGGKPSQRHHLAEHHWTINVVPGTVATLHADVTTTGGEAFLFEYSVNGGAFTEAFTVSDSGGQSVPLPGLADGGTVVVRVVDTARASSDTTADTVGVDHLYVRSDTTIPPAPDAPSFITGTADANANSVHVTWEDVTNETTYEVQRTTDDPAGAVTWAPAGEVGADVVTLDDTGLDWSTTYWYRVRATNSGGTSDWATSTSTTTPAQPAVTTNTVASLTGTAASQPKGFWDATVTAVVRDAAGEPVVGASVAYTWSAGSTVTGPCVTDAAGTCTVVSSALKREASVTFSVTDVTATDYTYIPTVTTTTVNKP